MTTSTARSASKPGSLLSLLTIILGGVFIVVGIGAWVVTSVQLNNQEITVPADASFASGSRVNNPISALAQIDIVGVHQQNGAVAALTNPDNAPVAAVITAAGIDINADTRWTFAALGGVNTAVNAAVADGTITAEQAAPILALRNTADQAAGIQGNLFTSVLAYGVSLFAVGAGVGLGLIGFALRKIAEGKAVEGKVVAEEQSA